MNKAHRCFLHLACIAVKMTRGQDFRWHWEHLMREFGMGTERDKPGSEEPELEKFHVIPHH